MVSSELHAKLFCLFSLAAGLMFFSKLALSDNIEFLNGVLFENFDGSNPIVNQSAVEDHKKYLWNQYPHTGQSSTNGWVNFMTDDCYIGEHCLVNNVSSGQLYLQFYPHNGSEWEFFHEILEEKYGITWINDYYNRLEFYILMAEDTQNVDPSKYNFSIGTYVRSQNGDRTNAEAGGHHFYHRYRIPYTGHWHKVVLDMHPHHDRGQSGDMEHGNQEYPTEEAGHNYFDALTRFYIASRLNDESLSSQWKLDGFRIYRETNIENEEQVYAMSGVYVPESNKLIVTWERNKNENDIDHELRYAFSDIHTLGWGNSTSTGEAFDTGGYNGYNTVHWESSGIDTAGHSSIFVAVKPVNSTLFKQIEIPLEVSGSVTSRPRPPRIISIQ
jgi:hypothetical protein